MDDLVFDALSASLGWRNRVIFTPHDPDPEERALVPNEKCTFDAEALAREILDFDVWAAAMYRAAGLRPFEYSVEVDFGYDVMPDGRWHINRLHFYLMLLGEPYLTPKEYVERDIAQRLLKPIKFVRIVVEEDDSTAYLWQCESGYVVVRHTRRTGDNVTWLGLHAGHEAWTLGIFRSDETGTDPAELVYEDQNHKRWSIRMMSEVIAGLSNSQADG